MFSGHGVVEAGGGRSTGSERAGRRRGTALLGLGLGAGLALAACASASEGGAGATGTAALAPATETDSTSPVPAPGASSGSAPPLHSASRSPTAADPPDDSRTFTTTSGVFTWTLPSTWTATVTQLDDSAEQVDYVGVPYEVVAFENAEGTAGFDAWTGIGPTSPDGPKHDVLEVLDTEELSDLPVSQDDFAQGPVWYRAAVLRANEGSADPDDPTEPVDPGETLLRVDVANIPWDVDVEDTAYEAFWSGFFYTVDHPNPAGEPLTSATLITGEILQSQAEELTGLDGEDAIRAVMDTPEYAELRDVMTSLRVSTAQEGTP